MKKTRILLFLEIIQNQELCIQSESIIKHTQAVSNSGPAVSPIRVAFLFCIYYTSRSLLVWQTPTCIVDSIQINKQLIQDVFMQMIAFLLPARLDDIWWWKKKGMQLEHQWKCAISHFRRSWEHQNCWTTIKKPKRIVVVWRMEVPDFLGRWRKHENWCWLAIAWIFMSCTDRTFSDT